ncbi:MAG: response regulator [Deltaproteobacteria bacterium]|nr:response regulator [Deltaproteobacteria bacterium]
MDDAKAPQKRSRVLLIEDSATQRARLAAMLDGGDIEVIEATDGLHGLRLAKTLRPDLIITDLEMPKLNGLALTKALRSDKTFAHVPIVMLTGHDEKELRVNAFGIGVDDFVTKPGDPDEVLARVTSLLRLRQALSTIEENNSALNDAMAQLRQGHKRTVAAQRLAYAGHLAAGIAHECNNPLAMLKANIATLIDYANDLAEAIPDDKKKDDEIQEVLEDLPDVARECQEAAKRLQKVVGSFAALQDEKATKEADTSLVPISAVLAQAVQEVRSVSPDAQLILDERNDANLQVRAAPADLKKYLVAFTSYMYRVLLQKVEGSALLVRIEAGPTQVNVCIDAPELALSPDEAEEQFTRWLVAQDGRVSFDVNLGAAREGLLAMGAIVEHLAIYGGGWSLALTFEREDDAMPGERRAAS